jgi:hypothetical protein
VSASPQSKFTVALRAPLLEYAHAADSLMERRTFVAGAATVLAAPLAVEGQPAAQTYRIGYLASTPPTGPSPLWEGFLSELRDPRLSRGSEPRR